MVKECNSTVEMGYSVWIGDKVTYLDWVMIFVAALSCLSMAFESPRYQMNQNKELQMVKFSVSS